MNAITRTLNSIIPTNLTKPSTVATVALVAAVIASVASLTFAAYKTAPLWTPALAASGLVGWTVLGGAGILLTVAIIILGVRACRPSKHSSAIEATHLGGLGNVLDFSYSSPNRFGYVADISGHNKPREERHTKTFDEFNQKLEFITNKKSFSISEIYKAIKCLSAKLEDDVSFASTMSFASIMYIEDRKTAVIAQIGDSSIYIVDKNGCIKFNTNKTHQDSHDAELGGDRRLVNKQIDKNILFPLEEGDIIFGVTDGITDFIKDEDIIKLLKASNYNAPQFLASYKTFLANASEEALKQKYDPNDKRFCDDISAFILRA